MNEDLMYTPLFTFKDTEIVLVDEALLFEEPVFPQQAKKDVMQQMLAFELGFTNKMLTVNGTARMQMVMVTHAKSKLQAVFGIAAEGDEETWQIVEAKSMRN